MNNYPRTATSSTVGAIAIVSANNPVAWCSSGYTNNGTSTRTYSFQGLDEVNRTVRNYLKNI